MPDAVCAVLCSWWWTEPPSETCRASYRNNEIVKLCILLVVLCEKKLQFVHSVIFLWRNLILDLYIKKNPDVDSRYFSRTWGYIRRFSQPLFWIWHKKLWNKSWNGVILRKQKVLRSLEKVVLRQLVIYLPHIVEGTSDRTTQHKTAICMMLAVVCRWTDSMCLWDS